MGGGGSTYLRGALGSWLRKGCLFGGGHLLVHWHLFKEIWFTCIGENRIWFHNCPMKPAGWHSNQWEASLQVIKSIYEFVDLFILFITEKWVCFFPFRTIWGSNVSILTPLINTDYFHISERYKNGWWGMKSFNNSLLFSPVGGISLCSGWKRYCQTFS